MRAVAAGFVVGLAAGAPLPGERDLSGYTYEHYLAEFKAGENASPERKAIFDKNMDTIRKHNADQEKSWFMTVNEFTDLTSEEFKQKRLGHLPQLDSFFVGELDATHINVDDLPEVVDWRTNGTVMSPVKNQGGCGSCWAFSATETLESHYAIATGNPAPVLSPQQIVSCSPNPEQCGGTGGCQGSTQMLAFNYTQTAGITTESNYPYQQQTGTCDQSKIKPCAQNDGHVKLKVNDYATHMDTVANKGPVAISLAAGSLQMYGGGILSSCGCDMDHAVQLVGYGSDQGTLYWLVRNSWGGMWGEQGYVRIKRFGEGKEPTCVDKTPQDGEACKGDTKPRTYAGLCGLLGSSSIPTGVKKVGDGCPAGPAPGPGPSPGPSPVPPMPPGFDCIQQMKQADCEAKASEGCHWCTFGAGMCMMKEMPCPGDVVV